MLRLPSMVHITFPLLFLCLITISSCAADNTAALLHDLKTGHYDFFLQADNAAYRSIKKMGRGSAYYVGLHLKRAGHTAAARFYFVLGEKLYESPFNALCREQLYQTGNSAECLASVQTRLAQLEKQDDSAALTEKELLTALRTRLLLTAKSYTELSAAPEQLYFAGSITQLLAEVFPQLSAAMKPVDRSLAVCRISVFEKRYQEAWIAVQAAFAVDALPAALAAPVLLSDIGKAGLYGAASPAEAAAFFESLAGKMQQRSVNEILSAAEQQRVRFYALFYAARCRGKLGGADQRRQAAQLFLQAAAAADTDADEDSALWYYLDTVRQLSLRQYLAALTDTAARWKNPGWYADLVQALRVQLTAAKDWEKLRQLYTALGKTTLSKQRAALAYTLAQSGELSPQEAARFLQDAVSLSASLPYYRIMTSYRLGKTIQLLPTEAVRTSAAAKRSAGEQIQPNGQTSSPTTESAPSRTRNTALKNTASAQSAARNTDVDTQKQLVSLSPQDAQGYIEGLLHFGLYALVYPQVTAVYPSISAENAVLFASALQQAGFYADSIRLVSFSLRNQGAGANEVQLRLLYPQPYRDIVAKYAEIYQLPEYLLYAVIRSESFFQAEIVSGAGAVGLTQLMPATAADIAKKLKISNYSLTDPELNIRFGAYYLAEMIRRLDKRILPACFAYNAGISRVRNWLQRNRDLPDDLLLESLDYAETRDYGRKILSAAVVYGALYYNEQPEDIIKFFLSEKNKSLSEKCVNEHPWISRLEAVCQIV